MRLVAATVALALSALAAPAEAAPRRDLDGDGFADAVLDRHALYRGTAAGLVADPDGQARVAPAAGMIYALEIVGDVDGDGYADLIVGDPGCPAFADDLPECEFGSARLHRGGPGGLAARPTTTLRAAARNTMFGAQVVALGDVDGDGKDDVALPDGAGVHVYLGTAHGLADRPIELAAAGTVVPTGDVDGDARAEVLVIAPGSATLYLGADPARARPIALGRDAEFYGAAGHGDFDGDGFGDLALTVEPRSPSGTRVGNRVVIYRGSRHGLGRRPVARLSRGHARAEFGAGFASVGDLDGDRRDDLVIDAACTSFDATGSSCGGSTAYVFRGGKRGLAARPLLALSPTRTNMAITNQLAALGDVDGDGRPDFAIGAFVYRGSRRGIVDRAPPSL